MGAPERKRDRWKKFLRGEVEEQQPDTSAPNSLRLPASRLSSSSARSAVSEGVLDDDQARIQEGQVGSPALPQRNSGPSHGGDVQHEVFMNKALVPPDFWIKALEQLSLEERKEVQRYIGTVSGDASTLLGQVLDEARKKRDIYEQKKWTISIGSRDYDLRDKVDQLVSWLDRFKQIGDIAVNADPVHAGLPWALVRTLLQLAVSSKEQSQSLILGLERVAYNLNRCKIHTALYLDSQSELGIDDAISNMEEALTKLYTIILHFLAKALILLGDSTFTRTAKAFWKPENIISFDEDCNHVERRLEEAVVDLERSFDAKSRGDAIARHEAIVAQLADFKDSIVPLKVEVDTVWTQLRKERRSRILKWTSPIPYLDHHAAAAKERLLDTCNWLLHREEFEQWEQAANSVILWLHGIPGAGKTKLVSRIVDYEMENVAKSNVHGFAYFYCQRYEESRRRAINVLQSFVKQLAMSHAGQIHQGVVAAYERKEEMGFGSTALSFGETEDLLFEIVSSLQGATLILDALDECHEDDRSELMAVFNRIIQLPVPVKIFISSRRNIDIDRQLRQEANIGIEANDNQGDIGTFVREKLTMEIERRKKQKILPIPDSLQRQIESTLLEKSQGMFQWASLQIHQLLRLEREKDIRARLGVLPIGLTKAYDEIILMTRSQEGSKPDVGLKALQWLWAYSAPIQADALLAAVCQDPNEEDILPADIDLDFLLDSCQNLVTVDKKGYCRFSHLSVEEYLDDHGPWTIQVAIEDVSDVCLRFICSEEARRPRDDIPEAFRKFAFDNWYLRITKKERTKHDRNISYRSLGLFLRFFGLAGSPSPSFRHWAKTSDMPMIQNNVSWAIYRTSENLPVFLACYWGLSFVYHEWIASGLLDVDVRTDDAISLLSFATAGENYEIAESLVKKGVRIDSIALWAAMNTAFLRKGDVRFLTLFLDHGADIEAMGDTTTCNFLHSEMLRNTRFGSALAAASYYTNLTTMKLLLSKGANPNIRLNGTFGSALVAAIWGTSDVTQADVISAVYLLLDHGAYVNPLPGSRESPLGAAIHQNRDEVVRMLLENGADANIRPRGHFMQYNCLIEAAFSTSNIKIAKSLTQYGADTTKAWASKPSLEALMEAAKQDDTFVDFLFSKDKELCGEVPKGFAHVDQLEDLERAKSLLLDLTFEGHRHMNLDMMKRLIMRGCSYYTQEKVTLIFVVACIYGDDNTEMLLVLLEYITNIDAWAYVSQYKSVTLLMAACVKGNEGLVTQILERGADVNKRINARSSRVAEKVWNALTLARRMKRSDVVELLEGYGAQEPVEES